MVDLPAPCFPAFPGREAFAAGPPSLDVLNGLAAPRGLVTGGGKPLCFVAATGAGGGDYERRAYVSGEVETRTGNLHDAFNALAWLAMPLTKAAINRRHAGALAIVPDVPGRRGALRDALAQFDECGVVVCTGDARLWELLRAHRWRELFHDRRTEVLARMRFLVLGHASLEALARPFAGLCGKAVPLAVDDAWLDMAAEAQWAAADRRLAGFLDATDLRPGDLQPLPFLGIPGLTADSEAGDYYDDRRQFRPRRR
ncbi:MAG: DUF3025 domain-containing protein [Rhodocyclaceae bacterium]|nr:DUF3025 domain-containing protein [Rhodocyclaceae bacterium]